MTKLYKLFCRIERCENVIFMSESTILEALKERVESRRLAKGVLVDFGDDCEFSLRQEN